MSADQYSPKGEPMDRRDLSREQFIRLGAAVGLSAAGASVMAACGSSVEAESDEKGTEAQGNSATASAETNGGGPKVGSGETITEESEVAVNSAFPFTDSETGEPAVLVHLEDGRFVAYSAICMHQGCTVAYKQRSQKLACPCHGGVFDPANGASVVSGPSQVPLQEIQVETRDGEVLRA